MNLEEMLEHLYDLDRKELRLLAYEALLISDGPDHVKGSSVVDAAIGVDATIPEGFTIWKRYKHL